MKANKKTTTGPSTDGSTTTPHRQETLIEKAENQKKNENEASEGPDQNQINEQDDEDDMHSDDSVSMMRLDSEICLPRATVNQLILEKLPADEVRISTNSKDLILLLSMTFLNTLAAKSNNVCAAKNKKTVCPDHVIDAMVEMNLSPYFAKMTNPDFTAKQTQKFLNQSSKKQKQDVLNRLSSQQESYGRQFRWGSKKTNNDAEDDGLTEQERADQQDALFKSAARDLEQQELMEQQQPAGVGEFSNTPGDNMDQKMVDDYDQDQQCQPISSTDRLMEAIDQTDFMVDDADEGLGGYDDVEMMPNDYEPPSFQFVNENNLELQQIATNKEIPQKKAAGVPLERQRSSSRRKGAVPMTDPEEESKM